MSSRLSLGGNDSRSVLRDASSRYNSSLSSASRRLKVSSPGGRDGEETPQKTHRGVLDSYDFRSSLLGDASSRTRSASAPRRQSFGGDALALRSETPQKDRRAMLEKWRQARAAGNRGQDTENKKRSRGADTPPLPPGMYTNTPSSSSAEANAYQSRKFQKVQQEADDTLSQISGFNQSINYFDDESGSDMGRSGGSRLIARTPSRSRRGLGGPARRKSVMPGTILQAPEGRLRN